jgi:hypothetical protein
MIAIHPSFDKLLTSLRTAVADEYKLDKTETSFNDILDAFRLSLTFYKRSKSQCLLYQITAGTMLQSA